MLYAHACLLFQLILQQDIILHNILIEMLTKIIRWFDNLYLEHIICTCQATLVFIGNKESIDYFLFAISPYLVNLDCCYTVHVTKTCKDLMRYNENIHNKHSSGTWYFLQLIKVVRGFKWYLQGMDTLHDMTNI